ncbi:cytochrome P450 monooxygenase xanG [Aspergillus tanneri]|uniref:Cytochrome P450-dit2 n=1 Tax=Aspergillus tanneri TaxID=1220188 RepID=A0A5M9MXW9_9EURO|nr:cytochrome P450-dit2 [Aspergillus tanneri]KAA8651961.1 cytochrome P450-dit2 [Aspergillus tanneri]
MILNLLTLLVGLALVYLGLTSRWHHSAIPTVPFWITLYDMCRGVGRTEFYETRLRPRLDEHGAVWMWNAGRWVVLVTKPEYLAHVFRHEKTVSKAGFVRKVPWGVLARLFGENIIDSHGATWHRFAAIMRPGIQKPRDIRSLCDRSARLASLLLQTQQSVTLSSFSSASTASDEPSGVVIEPLLQRWALSVYGDYFLHTELGCLETPGTTIDRLVTAVKRSIPLPLVGEFPVLERFRWLLPHTRRGFAAVQQFEEHLIEQVDQVSPSPAYTSLSPGNNKLIHRLKRAREQGLLCEYHYRSNLKMMTVAGHENVNLALTSALWELGRHPHVQEELRQEMATLPAVYTVEEIERLPLLTAVIYETLRLYPPLSQLVNRVAREPFPLTKDVWIPEGTWVGWNSYGVHTNPAIWGPTARSFQPARWGISLASINDHFRLYQARGYFIPFSAYSRRCLGIGFAILQMRIALVEILRRVSCRQDPTYNFSPTLRVSTNFLTLQ